MQPSTFRTRLAACGAGDVCKGGMDVQAEYHSVPTTRAPTPSRLQQPAADCTTPFASIAAGTKKIDTCLLQRATLHADGCGLQNTTLYIDKSTQRDHSKEAHLLQRVALNADGVVQVAGRREVLARVAAAAGAQSIASSPQQELLSPWHWQRLLPLFSTHV